ncbi:hypothetical protein V6N13_091216 [Hibiscus sabdariffa]
MYVTRHVVFQENEFPFAQKSNEISIGNESTTQSASLHVVPCPSTVQPHVDGMNGDVVLHESTQDEGYEVANDIPIHTSTHDEEYEVAGANVSIPTDAPNIVDKVHEQPLISTPVSGRSTVQASHSVSTSSSEQNGSPALSEEEVVATDQDSGEQQ